MRGQLTGHMSVGVTVKIASNVLKAISVEPLTVIFFLTKLYKDRCVATYRYCVGNSN